MEKRCCKCKQRKTVDHFTRSKSSSDGLYPRCRSCNALVSAEWRKAHPEWKQKAYKRCIPEKISPSETKRCSTCKQEKPTVAGFPRDKYSPDGRSCRCKACLYKLQINYRERHRTQIRDKAWVKNLKKKYGLMPEDYGRMLAAQKGGCAICGALSSSNSRWRLAVDHDHVSGKIRGLLCIRCNSLLGRWGDRLELLESAVRYLVFYVGGSKS